MLTRSRRRVLRAAALPIARTVPWTVVAGVLALGWAPLVWVVLAGGRDLGAAVVYAGIVAAGVVALAVDDAAIELSSSVPVPLAQRRGVRVAEVLCASVAVGLVLLAIASRRDPALVGALDDRFPEALAAAAVAVVVASRLAHRRLGSAGLVGAAAGPVSVGLVGLLAQRFAWLPALASPQHHDRWWAVAVGFGAVAAWSWRDPLARGPVRWRG